MVILVDLEPSTADLLSGGTTEAIGRLWGRLTKQTESSVGTYSGRWRRIFHILKDLCCRLDSGFRILEYGPRKAGKRQTAHAGVRDGP
jgi:hypothetical protein